MSKIAKAAVAVLIVGSSLHARTIVVDVNGTGEFEAIQPAMEIAGNQDTVLVLPGEYCLGSEFKWNFYGQFCVSPPPAENVVDFLH